MGKKSRNLQKPQTITTVLSVKASPLATLMGKLECLIDKFCENENISLSVNSLKCERLTKNTKTVFGKDNLKNHVATMLCNVNVKPICITSNDAFCLEIWLKVTKRKKKLELKVKMCAKNTEDYYKTEFGEITKSLDGCLSDADAKRLHEWLHVHQNTYISEHLINATKFNKDEMVRFLEAMLQCEHQPFWGMQSKKSFHKGLGLKGVIIRKNVGSCADVTFECTETDLRNMQIEKGKRLRIKQLMENGNAVGIYMESKEEEEVEAKTVEMGVCCLVDACHAPLASILENMLK